MRKRKKRRERFFWTSFVNADIATTKFIGLFTKYWLDYFKEDMVNELARESIAIEWKNQIIASIGDMKQFQSSMRSFIDHSILKHQFNDSIGIEYQNLRKFIEKESGKFESVTFASCSNIVKNVIIPAFCYDFMDKKNYWDQIIGCGECKKVFIPLTKRHQVYCCKKCRDKHRNKERIRSGEWAKKMQEYRKGPKSKSM